MTHQIFLVLCILQWKPNNEKLSTKTWLFLKNNIWADLQRQLFLWTPWIWLQCFVFRYHCISHFHSFLRIIFDTEKVEVIPTDNRRANPQKPQGLSICIAFCNKYSLSHRIPSKRSSEDLKIQANHCHATLNAFIFMSIKFHLLTDQSSSAATNLHMQPVSCQGASGHKIHECIKSEKGN